MRPNISTNYIIQKNKYFLKTGAFDQALIPENIESNLTLENEIFSYGKDYYFLKPDINKTLEYCDKLIEIKNKKIIENRKIDFSSIEEKYTNTKLTRKNQELSEEIQRRKRNTILTSGILLLSSGFLILQLFNNRRYKKLNNLLQEKKKDLEKSNDDLAKSNEELERFTFIASHDLKTPLRNIVSFSHLLEKKLESSKNEEIHEYLSYIEKSGQRLNNLIADTLEYSMYSNEETKLSGQLVDLNKVLKEIEFSMLDVINKKNVKFIILNRLASITTKYNLMVSLFQNIIENGIKYNKSNTPTIKIHGKENLEFYSCLFLELVYTFQVSNNY